MVNRYYSLLTLAWALLISYKASAQTPCVDGMAGIYPCQNVDLLAYMPLAEIGGGQNTNDVWGWKSPVSGKEYALVGAYNGTAFVDISTPTAPVYLGLLPTHTNNSLWRDLESKDNFLYVVSEAAGHGLQVFDLLQLDTVQNPPVNFAATAHYAGFGNAHTLNIDQASGYLYAMGTNTFSGGLHIVNIQNPLQPTLVGGFDNDGYTHDGFALVYNGPDLDHIGKEIVIACNADALTIVNTTDKTDCQMIATANYPDLGYVHQGWFTRDFRYFLENDETDETQFGVNTRTHIWDLLDLDNPVYMGKVQWNTTAIDHNLYIQDQFVYASNYRSGVRVWDAINVAELQLNELGYFDLFPLNDLPQFSGTWSNYPYLPSGVNLATSMYDGFFILQPNVLRLSQNNWSLCDIDEISLTLTVNGELQFPLNAFITGLPEGVSLTSTEITAPGTYTFQLQGLNAVPAGDYSAHLELRKTNGRFYALPLSFHFSQNSESTTTLQQPAEDALIESNQLPLTFTWEAVAGSSGYLFELVSVNTLQAIASENVISNSFTFNGSLDEGQYFWRVKVLNECETGEYTLIRVFNVIPTSVDEWQYGPFVVMPNPASNECLVQCPSNVSQLRVIDCTGRSVLNVAVDQDHFVQLDLRSLANGVYVVSAGKLTRKLVIQK